MIKFTTILKYFATDDSAHTYDGDVLMLQDEQVSEIDIEMENSTVVLKGTSESDTGTVQKYHAKM